MLSREIFDHSLDHSSRPQIKRTEQSVLRIEIRLTLAWSKIVPMLVVVADLVADLVAACLSVFEEVAKAVHLLLFLPTSSSREAVAGLWALYRVGHRQPD